MFSHRLHRFTQMVRLRKIVAEVSLPPQLQSASHRFHRSAQNFLLSGASHRLHRSAQKLLLSGASHRLHRSTQNCLLGMFSHRLHRFTQMVRLRKIVAEVSLPPQQQSASHRLHRFTQKLLILGGIKTRKRHAPKGQKHIAQGSALGKYAQH